MVLGITDSPPNLLLIAAWILGLAALALLIIKEIKPRSSLAKQSRLLPFLTLLINILLFVPLIWLAYLFYVDDFSYWYVASYSVKAMAVLNKLTGVWAGEEGSIVLWAFLIYLSFLWVIRKHDLNDIFLRRMHIIGYSVGLFFLSLSLVVTPFTTTNDFIFSQVEQYNVPVENVILYFEQDYIGKPYDYDTQGFSDGRGMSPILRDPWMAIHPPIVFVAYAFMVIPFAAALSFLWNRVGNWKAVSIGWTRIAWLFLTLGIALGGVWSYKIFGWGGFWAWDPVETSSLIPWLVMTAFLHSLIVYNPRKQFVTLAPVLAITTHILIIYATFVTRTGGSPLHALSDSATVEWLIFALANMVFLTLALGYDLWGRNRDRLTSMTKSMIIAFLGTQLLLALYKGIIYYSGPLPNTIEFAGMVVVFAGLSVYLNGRMRRDTKKAFVEESKSEEIELVTFPNLVYTTVLMFLFLTFVSFWGVTKPVINNLMSGDAAAEKITIDLAFYNTFSFPFMLVLLFVLGLCMLFGILKKDLLSKGVGALFGVALILAIAGGLMRFTGSFYVAGFAIPLALSLIAVLVKIVKTVPRIKSTGKKLKKLGFYTIHLGVVFIMIGSISATVFDQEHKATMIANKATGDLGSPAKLGSSVYSIGLGDFPRSYTDPEGWPATDVDLIIYKNGNPVDQGTVSYVDNKQWGYVTHVHAYKGIITEVYILFQGTSTIEGQTIVPLTVTTKPLISFLWIGIILLSIGIVPAIFIRD